MSTKLSVRQELLWAIEREPFSDERRWEYAEWLGHNHGDMPRALLIEAQCSRGPDQELVKRLLDEHGRRWMAEDLGISHDRIPPEAGVEFYKGFGWWPVEATYPNFQAAIDAGKYEDVNSAITADAFGLQDVETVVSEKVVLYAPHRDIGSAEAVREMRRRLGLRLDCDQVWELLAFGERYPDAQKNFPIAALGSSWVGSDGDRGVPYLGRWRAERCLRLLWFESGWYRDCRFAAVRPTSPCWL